VRELKTQVTDADADLTDNLLKLAALEKELTKILGQFATTVEQQESSELETGQLAAAKQSLTDEMQRLLGMDFRRSTDLVGGIAVDSEYIIFVIDTSGSMYNAAWSQVLTKVEETLSIYPQVKGIQVMNDMGDYMFSQYQGKWIPDTPARRKAIIKRLAGWEPFSNSSPVEGVEAAIRRFYAKDKRISLYVFGDDFARGSIQAVVDTVAQLNRADKSGKTRVRIHTVGFPVLFDFSKGLPVNAVRYAALMRKLAETNNGSFVGLNSVK